MPAMKDRRGALPWLPLSCLLLAACPLPDAEAPPEPGPCGIGAWGAAAELPDRVFVSEDGSPDGDGSREDPLDRIQDGLDLAGDEGFVGVVVGGADGGSVYSELVRFESAHRGLELRGRCAGLVTIDASGLDGDLPTPVRVDTGLVTLVDLTLTGGVRGLHAEAVFGRTVPEVEGVRLVLTGNLEAGLFASGGSTGRETRVRLTDSRVVANHRAGVYAHRGATVQLVDSEVTGNLPEPDTGEKGSGIELRDGGHLEAERVLLGENHRVGLVLEGEAVTAVLEDSLVVDNGAAGVLVGGESTVASLVNTAVRGVREVDGIGRGVEVAVGAFVQLVDCSIEDTLDDAVFASGDGEARLIRTTVTANRGWTGVYGAALTAVQEGLIDAREVAIRDVGYSAVRASGAGSVVLLSDVEIEGVRAVDEAGEGSVARGIYVADSGLVEAERVSVREVEGAGVFVVEAGSQLVFDALEITGVGPTPDGNEGFGIAVQEEGHVEGRGLSTADNWRYSIRTAGAGSTIVVRDSTLGPASAAAHADNYVGVLNVNSGSTATLTDVLVPDPLGRVLFAWGGGTVHTERLRVTGEHTGPWEGALYLKSGARLFDRDSLIEGALGIGIHAREEGTRVELVGTRILRGRPNAEGRRGRGISITDGAVLEGSGVKLGDNHDIGLVVDDGARASLTGGAITGTLDGVRPASGVGVLANMAGEVELTGVEISGSTAPGIVAAAGGVLRGQDLTITDNGLAGAVATTGGVLQLKGGVIAANRAHPGDGGGVGVFGHDDGLPKVIELQGVHIVDHPHPAVYVRGLGRYRVNRCTLEGPQQTSYLPGGLFAADVGPAELVEVDPVLIGTGLEVRHTEFREMETAVLFDRATGILHANSFVDVSTPLWAQHCDEHPPPTVDGQAELPSSCEAWAVPVDPLLSWTTGEVDLVPDLDPDP